MLRRDSVPRPYNAALEPGAGCPTHRALGDEWDYAADG
jgi:hypothetical protein